MPTQIITPSPPLFPIPLILPAVARLLLTEHASANLTPASELSPDLLKLRATTITPLLKEILTHTGYRHGGLNE